MQNQIKLGQKVRDKVTGFEGIVVSKVDYITGCSQNGVTPQIKAGEKYPDCTYIDYIRLEIIDEGVCGQIGVKDTGGDMADAPH